MKLCLQCLGQVPSKQVTAQLNTEHSAGEAGEAVVNNSALLGTHVGWMTKAGHLTKKQDSGKKSTFL